MNYNRYRIAENGKYVFHTFQEGQVFHSIVWLENTGDFITKADGSYYTYYLDIPDVNGKYQPDLTAILAEMKDAKITSIKNTTDASASVAIEGVTYNGGDSSASAITGAVALAKAQGLTEVGIWDINDETTIMTIIEAETIALAIGKEYAAIMYIRQARITAVKAIVATTEAEMQIALDAI